MAPPQQIPPNANTYPEATEQDYPDVRPLNCPSNSLPIEPTECEPDIHVVVRSRPRATLSRQQHMDRYLWATIGKAYLDRLAERNSVANNEDSRWTSEYAKSFYKEPHDHSAPDDALARTYPLYGTAAVSYWCPTPMNRAPFGRGSCITKPNVENYDQQFG